MINTKIKYRDKSAEIGVQRAHHTPLTLQAHLVSEQRGPHSNYTDELINIKEYVHGKGLIKRSTISCIL